MWERLTVDMPLEDVCWSALRHQDPVLFRRVGDKDRAVLAVGARREVDRPRFDREGCADDWYVGYLSYGLKDRLEHLGSPAPGSDGWPVIRWWVPRWVLEWHQGAVRLHTAPEDREEALAWVASMDREEGSRERVPWAAQWSRHTDRAAYLQHAARLKAHIQRGDIYEVNYCTTRETHTAGLDPFRSFGSLLRATDAAFAGFLRDGDRHALCASPERYLAFDRQRVVGQPMKGTRARSADPAEDRRLALELAGDPKERSENIMALDVMRHDLSRVAASRSVQVEELCAVRSHRHVHQMVSTVSAVLREGLDPWDAVLAAFPMASMTGAPKIRAMQLIEEVEDRPRGLFSGSFGFFAPDGTGDLNVVIRTLLHDARTGHSTLTTGSALTAACDTATEWAECELKARSVIDLPWTC